MSDIPRLTLRELLAGVDGGEVLDVATGAGGFIAALAESLRSYTRFTGVDINPDALAEAGRQFPDARFEPADAASLPFPDRSFDTVTLSNSLHHLPDPTRALGEMKRVLRPGGIMLVREMYRDHPSEARLTHVLAHDWWAEVNTRLGEYHRPAGTRQELLDSFAAIGLSEAQVVELAEEEERDRFGPEDIEQFIERNRRMLEKLAREADFPAHRARCEQLIARVRTVGILSSAALATIGRVPG